MLLTPAMMLQQQPASPVLTPAAVPAPAPPAAAAAACSSSARLLGVVKFYDATRKYGIATLSDGREIFVLQQALPINYQPAENDEIEFDIEVVVRASGSEKLEAKNILLQKCSNSTTAPTATASFSTTTSSSSPSSAPAVDLFSLTQATNSMGALQLKSGGAAASDPFGVVPASSKKVGASIPMPSSTKHSNSKKSNNTRQRNSNKKNSQQAKQQSGASSKQQQPNTNASSSSSSSSSSKKNNSRGKKGKRTPSNKQTNKPRNQQSQSQTETPPKFAESTLFQSPDPSKLPMPTFSFD